MTGPSLPNGNSAKVRNADLWGVPMLPIEKKILDRLDAGLPPPLMREHVAAALRNKGVRLGALGRGEEEIAVYDDLLARFGTATEPALREQVAMALVNKGVRWATRRPSVSSR